MTSHRLMSDEHVKENVSGLLGRTSAEANIIRFRFQRYTIFYILQGFIPNTITVLVSWFSFLIKPDAVPARVSIVVSSLIAIMLQYANLTSSIPKVGYFKAIDLWMMVCVVFIFLVQAEFAVICILKRQRAKIRPETFSAIDRWCSIGLLAVFALFSLIYFSVLGHEYNKQ